MYLDPWMIALLILSFGACAFFSRRGGFVLGATMTLKALEEQRIIKIEDDGAIKRWAPYNDLPVPNNKKGSPRKRK